VVVTTAPEQDSGHDAEPGDKPAALTEVATGDSAVAGRRPRVSLLEVGGSALTLAGVLLVLFVGYLFGWSDLQASHNQHKLLATYSRGADIAAFKGKAPADGQPAAVLQIPSIGLRQVVVEGTTATDLQQGPGLMPRTAFPGAPGDSVIAGRRLTFGGPFASIPRMTPGETFGVVDFLGSFRYDVVTSFVVPAGSPLPVTPSHSSVLLLVTSARAVPPSGLFVVEARLVGKPANPTSKPPSASRSELALGGDSGATWQFLGWGALLLLGVAATVVAYRRVRRPALVYMLSTPVLLIVALFTFENVARFLPATM
jgi:sortase A